jgi:beta-glucanase (GH16 family)
MMRHFKRTKGKQAGVKNFMIRICEIILPKLSRLALLAVLLSIPLSSPAAWQLVWSDEFTQPDGSSPDSSKWGFDTGGGGWGNNELEYYTSRTNNARIVGNQLVIEAKQESFGGRSYTSARLLTKGKWSWTYGRMEARLKIPKGQGIWPAFWMLGANIDSSNWPACGEIDIMENIGKSTEQGKVYGTIHGPQNGGDYNGGAGVGGNYTLPNNAIFSDDFHVFAVEWTTNQMKWYVDSNLYFTATPASLPSGGTWPFTQPQFFLLNVAVGGNWPGNPDGTTVFPQQMLVDYVRVYNYVPSAPSAPTGFTASPGSGKVFLTWDDSTSGATAYNIKRATSSGGPYIIVGSSTTDSFTDSGMSDCSTYYYVVTATNVVGESAASSEQTAALGAYAVAVNSGGSAAGQFIADAYFTGGTQAAPTTSAIDTSGLVAPAPQSVYQSERYGSCTYTFPGLTSGVNYRVRLHLAEYYWTSVGQRRFNVSINGTQVLTNFDIIAVTGAQNKATIQEFTATASGGQIVIQFTTVTDNAKIGGIELVLARTATPASLNTTAGNSQVSLKWNAVAGATYTVKRAASGSGPFTTLSSGLSLTNYTDSGLTNGVTCFYVVSASMLGCESTNSVAASATPVCTPPASPVAGNNGPLWMGMTLNLTASTVPGVTYSWSGPNGFSSTSQNPVITNVSTNAAGIYSVTTTAGGCSSAPTYTTVIVNPPAQVIIQPSGDDLVLSWPAGTLQSATNATGPWVDVAGATSPLTNPAVAAQEFFRVRTP